MFDRLDRNSDGRLDGDEVENMPGFFRGMLDRAGIGEGASRDDFSRGFDRMRESREQQESGDRNGDRSRSAENNYYKPAERPRVTLELPDTFRDRDLDGDGQIGFYEWREWDRSRTDDFLFIDLNGDGFLTPKELESAGNFSMGDGGSGTYDENQNGSRAAGNGSDSVDRSVRGGEASASDGTPVSSAGGRSSASFDQNDPKVSRGLGFFKLLDANGDGNVNPDEWSASRRLRPLFESAGARLDRDMTQDEFLSTYLKTDG